tara:strand:+ start:83 stop:478 length:396 start_codon:yes stop_codon:yes gene_type:complete
MFRHLRTKKLVDDFFSCVLPIFCHNYTITIKKEKEKFMSNSVNIPDSIKEIKQSIARRITILAEWQTKLAKTRKHSLRISRQLQVDATRQQIAELRQALKVAQEKAEIEKAKAFVASLAQVRKDWENGLFD